MPIRHMTIQMLIVREEVRAKYALIATRSFHFYPSIVLYQVLIYHYNLAYCLATASSSVNNLTITRCFINALTITLKINWTGKYDRKQIYFTCQRVVMPLLFDVQSNVISNGFYL